MLGGIILDRVDSITDLGIVIDCRMSFVITFKTGVSFRHLLRHRNSALASVVSTLKSVCLSVRTTLLSVNTTLGLSY
jgi:hypothetical protein